jgi:hypothetical protein
MMAHKLALASLVLGGTLCAAALTLSARPAFACGGELPISCAGADGAASEARWMLRRVAAAVQADEPGALRRFSRGEGGFRTQDSFVFCVGSDGRVSAHPDPALIGRDASELRFAAELLDEVPDGELVEVSYLSPRPGSSEALLRTSYATRANGQVCAIGYYE